MTATQFAVLSITLCYAYMDDPEYLENCSDKVLKFRSCKKWARDEIRDQLCLNLETPPLQIVEEFEDKMAEMAKNSFIFDYAKEMAQEIAKLLSTV